MLEPHAEALGLSSVAGFFYGSRPRGTSATQFLGPQVPAHGRSCGEIAKAGSQRCWARPKRTTYALGIPGHHLNCPETPAPSPPPGATGARSAGGLSLAAYEDHLEHLRHPLTGCTPAAACSCCYSASVGARYERELFARVQIPGREAAAAALSTSVYDLDIHFPRTAICKLGARCPTLTYVLRTRPTVHRSDRFWLRPEQVWESLWSRLPTQREVRMSESATPANQSGKKRTSILDRAQVASEVTVASQVP